MVWQIWLAYVVAIASAAWSYSQAKKMQNQRGEERGGISVTRFGTDKSLPVVYGKRKLKPVVVYQGVKELHDDDVTNETYYAILVWGIGPVTAITDLKFDDRPYTEFGEFSVNQRVESQLGGLEQTMPAWFAEEAPDDMNGMFGKGLAITYVKLAMDKEYKRYPQGRPDFSAVIEARSSNPIEAMFDYFTNTDYGMGAPAQEWDKAFNDTMISYCNNVVDGHHLMTCNIALDTEKPLKENFLTLAQSCRGHIVDGQNGLKIEIDRQKEPVLHITESMLTSGLSTTSLNINQRYNQVTIRYPDRDLNWETNEVVFPEKDSELHQQWLEQDGGIPLTHEETVDSIDNYAEALQFAEVLARVSRDSMTVSVSVKSFVGWRVEEMDVVTFENQLRGWQAKPFSVREIEYGEKETKLKLVEYQDSHYLFHPKPPKPEYPDTQLPNPLKVAPPSDLSFSLSDQPDRYGMLTWRAPAGFIESYDVRIASPDGEVIWQQNTKLERISIPILLSGRYSFSVRAIGPLATSGWALLDVDVSAPSAEFSVEVDAGNTYVILRPSSNQLAWGTEYEFWFNEELRGRGVAWQIEGLSPDTEYQFQVRAVNAVGQSEFITVTAKTTNDSSVILDIIGDALDQKLNQSLGNALAQATDRVASLTERQDENFESLLSELEQTRQREDIEREGVASAFAKSTLNQHTSELKAHAESLKELYAGFESNEAYIKQVETALSDTDKALAEAKRDLLAKTENNAAHISELSRAISDTESALAETAKMLLAKITEGDEETLARASEYTRAAVGYCVDKDGNLTSHTNAVMCVAAGHSWLDGPLAEYIRNLQVTTGSGTASVTNLAQAFVDADGELVARGAMLTDVNGKVSGIVNHQNGQISAIDLIADRTRIGTMNGSTFNPLLSLDAVKRELVLRARMVLGDGFVVDSKSELQSLSAPGMYSLKLRAGIFPDNATATNDFVQYFQRQPKKDEHLTYVSAAGDAASTKRFTGYGWTTPSVIVHGDMLAMGTVSGDRFKARTEIEAPILRGGLGEFAGSITAKEGSLVEKLEIGSAGGYKVFIKSVSKPEYNVISVENGNGDVVFSLQGNGQIYSVGGGHLDNLTLGKDCTVLGTVYAEQIVGDIMSTKLYPVPAIGSGNSDRRIDLASFTVTNRNPTSSATLLINSVPLFAYANTRHSGGNGGSNATARILYEVRYDSASGAIISSDDAYAYSYSSTDGGSTTSSGPQTVSMMSTQALVNIPPGQSRKIYVGARLWGDYGESTDGLGARIAIKSNFINPVLYRDGNAFS
ncbi:TPA: hypothetical protein I7122_21500 [Vibrio vulnificus]|nr:hypothetical protein [Vibrio vulnificus]